MKVDSFDQTQTKNPVETVQALIEGEVTTLTENYTKVPRKINGPCTLCSIPSIRNSEVELFNQITDSVAQRATLLRHCPITDLPPKRRVVRFPWTLALSVCSQNATCHLLDKSVRQVLKIALLARRSSLSISGQILGHLRTSPRIAS